MKGRREMEERKRTERDEDRERETRAGGQTERGRTARER